MREAAEKELAEATARAREEVAPLLAAGRHREVLERMVALRPVIDAFFDAVMVMDEDAAQRNNRLALLKELSALFLQYADFSLMVIPGDARTGDAQGDA
jgi:glycyl-tRNA synthetase beta chain